jgi:LysM repeat protein
MTLLPVCCRVFFCGLLAFILSGCFSNLSNELDEQKEPYFLKGKSRVSSMDYRGAVEAFEKALEVNPRSASAHFELGVLYYQRMQDFAAAIYHFERHLRLRPDSPMGEIVAGHIQACKLELLKTVPFSLMNQTVERELTTQNQALRQELDSIKQQLAHQSNLLAQARRVPPPADGYPDNSGNFSPSERPAPAFPRPAPQERFVPPVNSNPEIAQRPFAPATGPHPGAVRTYRVKPGDTPFSIARMHGLRHWQELTPLNPGLTDPTKLQAGQVLRIPAAQP